VFAARVVEAVDVLKEGDLDFATGLPIPSPDQFCLQGFEEAFDGGIVVAIALAAHRNPEPALSQELLIVVRAVLRSAIRVMDTAWWWPSDCDGHVQGTQCQILLHAVADRPADYAARKQINDYS
jgi:hypothetical protein